MKFAYSQFNILFNLLEQVNKESGSAVFYIYTSKFVLILCGKDSESSMTILLWTWKDRFVGMALVTYAIIKEYYNIKYYKY